MDEHRAKFAGRLFYLTSIIDLLLNHSGSLSYSLNFIPPLITNPSTGAYISLKLGFEIEPV